MTSRLKQNAALQFLALAIGSITSFAPHALVGQSTPPAVHNVIVLDPAHGGSDTGAHLSDDLEEKDVTLAFSSTLRTLLGQGGFTVVTTRDAELPDTAPVLLTDQRASTANHARALACILIHATASGSGIHISTSSLPEQSPDDSPNIIPWDTAQSTFVTQSRRLANNLGVALVQAKIPTLLGHSSVRPLDNLTCPAVSIEIAPLSVAGANNTSVNDTGYQQRIAQSLSSALISWRNKIEPNSQPARPNLPATPKPRTTPKPAVSPTATQPPVTKAPAASEKPAPRAEQLPKPPSQTPPATAQPAPSSGVPR